MFYVEILFLNAWIPGSGVMSRARARSLANRYPVERMYVTDARVKRVES